ncbi:RNA-binding S4 domain-containing protein [Roseibium hamelinense]|uniref:RNA-binding S4 domain-containing protein n=1 Tax=Roseibium hamelinense TaxID=150831 RepID=UPI0011A4E71F|nr:RNA-binding S4 domain-containing protein [Roseibium hamelinense]MTI43477.1 RNA-binding S4 domain-containing protein [Roseibium hamelinense]
MSEQKPDNLASLRVDKWLWYARVTKTRSLAQKLAAGGQIRLNKDKISSASKLVRVGDVLTITLDRRILVLKIQGLGVRRGPYTEARLLYEDLSPPPSPKPEAPARAALREPGAGRPTKRDRRKLDALRDSD